MGLDFVLTTLCFTLQVVVTVVTVVVAAVVAVVVAGVSLHARVFANRGNLVRLFTLTLLALLQVVVMTPRSGSP